MEHKTNSSYQDNLWKGIGYVCSAFFLFTTMQALNKLLTGQHHVVEITFYRSFIALIPCCIYLFYTKNYHLLKTTRPIKITIRAVLGFASTILTLGAIQHLPMSDATVLFFSATLLVPILAHFFLKEHIGLHRWVAVLIGMIGVILIAQPSPQMTAWGIVLALGAAATHAFAQVLIRSMKQESAFTITFYLFFGGLLLSGLAMPWFAKMPTFESAFILIAIGITGGFGQLFITKGFQLAPASLLAPFAYTGIIWATGFDIIIWHYVPGWPVYLGASIIIAAKAYIIYREHVRAKQNIGQA